VPYPRNARTHSAEQVDQLVASIKEWGWTTPVLLDEAGGIIAGHGRVLAAKKLGFADVPCMVAVGWTEAQRKAYVIADNKLALGADWDEAILKTEFATLQEIEFDVGLTGFSGAEIGALMAMGDGGSLTDPDEAPEPPASAVSRPGDVWLLGSHRLRGRGLDLCRYRRPGAEWRQAAPERTADLFHNCGTSESVNLGSNPDPPANNFKRLR